MRINSVGIFANPNNDQALNSVMTVCAIASRRNISCCIDSSFSHIRELREMPDICQRKPDIMVALGGDGTILRAASLASQLDIPVLGINFGRIGFLSEITLDELDAAFDRILGDDYFVNSCMMLSCGINDKKPVNCLNEAVHYRKDFSGVVPINVKINGMDAGTVSCDGLIVSTPTGATGYSISAGGPIIAQGLDVDIITPICPHTLSFRPIVAAADSRITLSMSEEGFLSMDGIYTEKILPGDRINICKSDRSVNFIRFEERNIYSLIRNKLS